jgi:hypothetical protein
VTLGGPPQAAEQLLLGFPREWTALNVVSAFLILPPAPEAEPSSEQVEVRVSRLNGPWQSGCLSSSPPSTTPRSNALANTPESVLRVDVTQQFRAMAQDSEGDYGLLIEGTFPVERGATYLTGADGPSPHLEVYGPSSARAAGQP